MAVKAVSGSEGGGEGAMSPRPRSQLRDMARRRRERWGSPRGGWTACHTWEGGREVCEDKHQHEEQEHSRAEPGRWKPCHLATCLILFSRQDTVRLCWAREDNREVTFRSPIITEFVVSLSLWHHSVCGITQFVASFSLWHHSVCGITQFVASLSNQQSNSS